MKRMILILACIASLMICSVAGATDQSQLQTMNKQAKLSSVEAFDDNSPVAANKTGGQSSQDPYVDSNTVIDHLIRMGNWF